MAGITSNRRDLSPLRSSRKTDTVAVTLTESAQAMTSLTHLAAALRKINDAHHQAGAVSLIAGRLCARFLWHHQQSLLLMISLHPQVPRSAGVSESVFESAADSRLRDIRRRATQQQGQRSRVARELRKCLLQIPRTYGDRELCTQVTEELECLRKFPNSRSEFESNDFYELISDAIDEANPIESVLNNLWNVHATALSYPLKLLVPDQPIFELGSWIEEAYCPPDVGNYLRRRDLDSDRWWQQEEDEIDDSQTLSREEVGAIVDRYPSASVEVAQLKPNSSWIADGVPLIREVSLAVPIFAAAKEALEKTISSGTRDEWIARLSQLEQEFGEKLGEPRSHRPNLSGATFNGNSLGLGFDQQSQRLTRTGYETTIVLKGDATLPLVTSLMQGRMPRVARDHKRDQEARAKNNLLSQQVRRLNKKIAPLQVKAVLVGEQYEFFDLSSSANAPRRGS